jgi:hypothetical protein
MVIVRPSSWRASTWQSVIAVLLNRWESARTFSRATFRVCPGRFARWLAQPQSPRQMREATFRSEADVLQVNICSRVHRAVCTSKRIANASVINPG